MLRVGLAIGIAVLAALLAWLVRRRAPAKPAGASSYAVPVQLDRADFSQTSAPWLVAVFTASSCDGCATVWRAATALQSDLVAVEQIEVGAQPKLHRRYLIDAVPTTVVADTQGVVRISFLGSGAAAELGPALNALLSNNSTLPE